MGVTLGGMYAKSAAWYDLLHTHKDYAGEARAVAGVIREYHPRARSLLDVACGTGAHLGFFRAEFDCFGVDIDDGLLEIARERFPDVGFTQSCMTRYAIGRTFDAVTCLFSAIGYVQTNENLDLAMANMARHLNPGGVAVVEPWILPENWDAWVAKSKRYHVSESDGLTIARVRATRRYGTMTELIMHYAATDEHEITAVDEVHKVRMFTVEELIGAAGEAGLTAKWDPEGITGRGLLIAIKQ